VQDNLRAQGMRNVYAYGFHVTGNGFDPVMTFNHFMIAHGGKDFITPDGKLHTDDSKVREAPSSKPTKRNSRRAACASALPSPLRGCTSCPLFRSSSPSIQRSTWMLFSMTATLTLLQHR
jgi:hypothetical protein